MDTLISSVEARKLISQLRNAPIAPGRYSRFINVGTKHIIDALDKNYFQRDLADGIGCFKYLEGDYGSGKTQFINSLAQRAGEQEVVSAIASIGEACPFNSPAGIVRAIMRSFRPLNETDADESIMGIEVLLDNWIEERIRQSGDEPGDDVSESIQRQIEEKLGGMWKGAPDTQMAAGLKALSMRLLKINCGASESVAATELTAWMRGDNVRSATLREVGLYEPLNDGNAFQRLKTVISFLRTRMGHKGFLIAFDEGTRTSSFRRGTVKQRQAIENLLTMINDNAEGHFGGVMFLYAATPDFRADVISNYRALDDRIGSVAFREGSPLVPLIILEDTHSEEVIREIGERLLDVFAKAYEVEWDMKIQRENMNRIIEAQQDHLFETPKPRFFVYQYLRFLDLQSAEQKVIDDAEAAAFVSEQEQQPPQDDEDDEL